MTQFGCTDLHRERKEAQRLRHHCSLCHRRSSVSDSELLCEVVMTTQNSHCSFLGSQVFLSRWRDYHRCVLRCTHDGLSQTRHHGKDVVGLVGEIDVFVCPCMAPTFSPCLPLHSSLHDSVFVAHHLASGCWAKLTLYLT